MDSVVLPDLTSLLIAFDSAAVLKIATSAEVVNIHCDLEYPELNVLHTDLAISEVR